ncbi:MAG: S8 family serine peptidase [Bryobacteraceae bacterium]
MKSLRKGLLMALVAVPLLVAQAPKQKITRAADLPVFTYKLEPTVEDVLLSDQKFHQLAVEIRKNVESVLAKYEIEDKAALRGMLSTLINLDLLEHRDADTLKLLDQIKDLEEKPAAKLLSGLSTRAILQARAQFKDRNSPEYRQAVYKSIRAALDGMPFTVIENDLKQRKSNVEIVSKPYLIGGIQAEFDPALKKNGGMLSSDMVHFLPNMRVSLDETIPLKDTLIEAYGGYLAAHQVAKQDIWAARSVQLEPGKGYAPVNVAVWDSGVDSKIFSDRLVKDKSGNLELIAFDLESRRSSGELFPLTPEQQKKVPALKSEVKGFTDMQANLDTPDAAALKKKLSAMKPDQVKQFFEDLDLAGSYMHGTHVAGILMDGNPYARLALGRISFDYKIVPDPCPSPELVARDAASTAEYVDFFKRNGVRVVNMSWGLSVKEYESAMEMCGIGKTADERRQIARGYFDSRKAALVKAFNSAPEILFVAAAGNSNSSASFEEFVPSSLRLPNLLTVGAVDLAGDEASFTSYGPTVVVHANGYEVESYVPGGDRMKLSGTSMASPNTANLAAKIIAVNPKLKPPEVIAIITSTADRTADGRRNLINPRKAVELAQRQ